MLKKADFNWSNCTDENKGNLIAIRSYNESEKWQEFNKKASDQAEFSQLSQAAKIIASKLKKEKKEYIISIWFKGELRQQSRSRLFTNN